MELCFEFSVRTLHSAVSQSVASPTADPGIVSSIPAMSNNFVEIDHEIISIVI